MQATRLKRAVAVGALVAAGFGTGAAVAVTGSASAATDATTSGIGRVADNFGSSKSINPDEHLLTGDKLAKVTAAAKAANPDATIERVETDSDGVYEAHMVTADGQQIIVQVDANFEVTGTQTGFGGHNGVDPDPNDDDGPGTPGGTTSGTTTS